MCSAVLFAQEQKQFIYTSGMLKHDATSTLEDFNKQMQSYEKLSIKEKTETPPPVPTVLSNGNMGLLLIASGIGKMATTKTARVQAQMNCGRNLLLQFVYKNKKVKELTKDAKEVHTQIVGPKIYGLAYDNKMYGLVGESISKDEQQDLHIVKYTCAADLLAYDDRNDSPLVYITYK